MERTYSTNEICEICDVSRKQLRYYEERGMLSNVQRHEANNYRRYSHQNILEIIAAKALRSVGMSLDEVKDVFYDRSPRGLQLSIEKTVQMAKENMEQSILRYEQSMLLYARLIEAFSLLKLNKAGDRQQPIAYEVVDVPARDVIALDYISNWRDEERRSTEYGARIQTLAKQVNVAAPATFIYLTYDHFDSEQCTFDGQPHAYKATMEVADTQRPCDHYLHLEGFRGVAAYHTGDWPDTLEQTYVDLMVWAKEQGYHLANWSVEEWYIGSVITSNMGFWLMRIIIPFDGQ